MRPHVIIIGAGASGLMAASVLSENDYPVTVVEARERIGGRIHTIPASFTPQLEMGAEFVHGNQPLTQALAREAMTSLQELSGHWFQFRDGGVQQRDFFDRDWELLTEALEHLETDMEMGQFLDQHFGGDQYARLREKVRGFVQGYDAADVEEASALSLRDEWAGADDARQFRIRGGYGALVRHLEKRIRDKGGVLLTSMPVNSVHWSRGRVKVFAEDGKVIDGDKVIITVPIGVLQKRSITFQPRLPAHERAVDAIGYGGVIKFFLAFDTLFWQDPAQPLRDAAFVISDAVIPTWWTQRPDNASFLTGWFGGPPARSADHSAESLLNSAVESVAYIFSMQPATIRAHLRDWLIANWVSDPFSCGAYGYPKVGTVAARAFLSQAVEDTLYFAGEALYTGSSMGTVEAALVSGREVATKLGASPSGKQAG